MSTGVTTLIGAAGAVAAVLAVLLPVVLAQGASLRRRIDTLRSDLGRELGTLRGDLGELRRELHTLSDRVAGIEVDVTCPWLPRASGPPAPPPGTPPEVTHE